MLVRAKTTFGGTGHGHFSAGQVFHLPAGVDWLKAGLVEQYDGLLESAMLAPAKARVPAAGRQPASIVPGVDAALLADAGITTVAELAASSEFELTKIKGIGKTTARKWLKAAREMLR